MTDAPEELINGMCMTWRHDFGLDRPEANKDGIIGWSDGLAMGMTIVERDGLRMQMRQLYQHHILPAILQARSQAYEECAKIVDDAAFWAGEEAEIQRVSDRRMASSAQKYALEKAATAIRSKANQ